MHNAYRDIRSRIQESPRWWDENGVPRYGLFATDRIADIYADECALVMIACQGCRKEFMVAFSASQHGTWMNGDWSGIEDREAAFDACKHSIAKQIRDGSLHYGDPPNTECCPAGPTMNCLDVMVLEYWRLNDLREWERVSELELMLADHREYQEPKEPSDGS